MNPYTTTNCHKYLSLRIRSYFIIGIFITVSFEIFHEVSKNFAIHDNPLLEIINMNKNYSWWRLLQESKNIFRKDFTTELLTVYSQLNYQDIWYWSDLTERSVASAVISTVFAASPSLPGSDWPDAWSRLCRKDCVCWMIWILGFQVLPGWNCQWLESGLEQ